MRQDEAVDHHFLALDIGLPTEQLAPALRAALSDGGERIRVELDAVNRRGRAISCVTTVMPLHAADGDGTTARGAIVLMQDGPQTDGDGARAPRPT